MNKFAWRIRLYKKRVYTYCGSTSTLRTAACILRAHYNSRNRSLGL